MIGNFHIAENQEKIRKTEWISKAKGFGILGVVAVHAVKNFTVPAGLRDVADAGMYCVPLFFVISAYLTFLSLEKQKTCWTVKGYLKFLGHKLVRLIPILYTAVLWHVLLYSVRLGRIPEIDSPVWKASFFAVTFLNGFSFRYINPWLNWYIGDLVIFWAIAPVLYQWINSPKKSVLFFIVAFLFSWFSGRGLVKFGVETSWYFYFWFPRQLPLLAIGMMFYNFQKSTFALVKNSMLTLAFVVSVCMLLSIFGMTPMGLHVRYGLFLFVFAYTLFNYSGRLFNWLKLLGDNSYGIYLYHMCLIIMLEHFVNEIGIRKDLTINFFVYYVAVVVVSLLLSKLANVVFEKPFFRFMRKKFGI